MVHRYAVHEIYYLVPKDLRSYLLSSESFLEQLYQE